MSKQTFYKRVINRTIGLLTVFLLASVFIQNGANLITPADDDSWGSEALVTINEGVKKISPIPLANACGLGASSCFRCHNGRRADLPTTGEEGPWHAQHASVNYSCAGCHKGNPRIIKQEVAHKDLVANPVAHPEGTCTSCHAGETTKHREVYLPKFPALKEGASE